MLLFLALVIILFFKYITTCYLALLLLQGHPELKLLQLQNTNNVFFNLLNFGYFKWQFVQFKGIKNETLIVITQVIDS